MTITREQILALKPDETTGKQDGGPDDMLIRHCEHWDEPGKDTGQYVFSKKYLEDVQAHQLYRDQIEDMVSDIYETVLSVLNDKARSHGDHYLDGTKV